MMRYDHQRVKLSEIDAEDITFRITTETNNTLLENAIKFLGVVNPPVIIRHRSRSTVVCGFRRIETCRQLNISELEMKILHPETQGLDCARLAVADNALQRPLNLIEKARSIQLLSKFIRDENLLIAELAAVGLVESSAMVNKIKKLCQASPNIQMALLSDTISFAVALELGRMKPEVSAVFIDLFEHIKLSLNKQREVITMATEIALREDITIESLFKEHQLQAILKYTELDGNQKARMMRAYLKKRRYPFLSAAEKNFERRVKELKLETAIKVIPPINFEGSTYSLVINFENLKELKDRHTSLGTMIQNPALEKILARPKVDP